MLCPSQLYLCGTLSICALSAKITQCQIELTSAFRIKEPVPQIKTEICIWPRETQLVYLGII